MTVQIQDETEQTATVVCGERAYTVPRDVANELQRLRETFEAAVERSAQRFREECLADRGYTFVRKDGSTAIWHNIGMVTTIEAAVDGNGKCIFTEVPNAGVDAAESEAI